MKIRLEDLVARHKPITCEDVVVDVGAHLGDYTGHILDRFDCSVIAFEPNLDSLVELQKRFLGDNRVLTLPLALSNEEGYENFYLNFESSSFFSEWAKTNKFVGVRVRKLSDVINLLIKRIPAIVKLNCEGAEYAILEDLDKAGLLGRISEVLVQFHRIPNYGILQPIAERRLSKTHDKIYDFKWQLWTVTPPNIGIESGQRSEKMITANA